VGAAVAGVQAASQAANGAANAATSGGGGGGGGGGAPPSGGPSGAGPAELEAVDHGDGLGVQGRVPGVLADAERGVGELDGPE
jgi:hypothetical protein